MSENTNREVQFLITPAAIERYRNALQQLPFDELFEKFRIQEGVPETVVERDSGTDTNKLVDSIIDQLVDSVVD